MSSLTKNLLKIKVVIRYFHFSYLLPIFLFFQTEPFKKGDKVINIHSKIIYVIDSVMHRKTSRQLFFEKKDIFFHAHDLKGKPVNWLPASQLKKIDEQQFN